MTRRESLGLERDAELVAGAGDVLLDGSRCDHQLVGDRPWSLSPETKLRLNPSGGRDWGWLSLRPGSLDDSETTVTSQQVCGRGPTVWFSFTLGALSGGVGGDLGWSGRAQLAARDYCGREDGQHDGSGLPGPCRV